jgi:hypothetical protein
MSHGKASLNILKPGLFTDSDNGNFSVKVNGNSFLNPFQTAVKNQAF